MLVLAMAAGCGGGEEKTGLPPAPGGGSASGPAFDMSKATATVSGKINFEGTPPPATRIQMAADPYCASHAQNTMTEEVLVQDGGLQNVIVYVKSGHENLGAFRPPTEPVVIDQKDCRYVPHVFTMMANQPLEVTNSDSTLHNIHSFPKSNPVINVGQPVQGAKNSFKLTSAEAEPMPFRCDVHKWMNSYVGVFDHPFHTVSKEGGTYELKLPPGKYELVAWHERYGTQTMNVEVAENDNKEIAFTFKPAA
jgi:hypothetical protein